MKSAHISEIREIVTAAVGPDTAPKLTEAIVRATELLEEETAGHVATKEDILLLKTDIAEFKADVTADLATVKTDVAELKTDVAGLKTGVAGLNADVATLNTGVAALKTDSDGLRERTATKEDLAVLKAEFSLFRDRAATKEDLQKLAKSLSGQFMNWFFGLAGLVLTAAGLVLGGVYYMLTHIKPA